LLHQKQEVKLMNYSNYQKAVFEFVENGQGNAIIEAVAGSGKTTTIVEAMKRVPAGASALFLAFNKAIAEELKSRGVNARTFHSFTYSPVLKYVGARAVESNKTRTLIDYVLKSDSKIYYSFVNRLVGLAKQAGIGCLIDDTEANWAEIANHHDLELESEQASFAKGLAYASQVLEEGNASQMVDFDDMLYYPVLHGIRLPKYDYVFVDEAQDTNAIQRALLKKILNAGGRIIAVGDPSQAIYGFRGADSEALNLIASDFSAIRLPLHVSYRCPKAVVKHAQNWVSHIQHADTAAEGKVTYLKNHESKHFSAGDMVVCRTTAPIIALAYSLIRDGVPAYVMGREIGQGLKSLVTRLNAKGIDQLLIKLEDWKVRECERFLAKGDDAKVNATIDKSECLRFLIEGLNETNRTIPALNAVIDNLFADKANAVKLATIHKSKGLEAKKVFWLNSSKCPAKWAKKEWQQEQERNLCYVATTRAQEELVLIEDSKE
jgi:DNA helicase II / ATP-dependent DNA helicase PcrA